MENLKEIQVEVDGEIVIAHIDKDSQPKAGVEILFPDETPLDGIYILPEYSYSVEIKFGIIQ